MITRPTSSAPKDENLSLAPAVELASMVGASASTMVGPLLDFAVGKPIGGSLTGAPIGAAEGTAVVGSKVGVIIIMMC